MERISIFVIILFVVGGWNRAFRRLLYLLLHSMFIWQILHLIIIIIVDKAIFFQQSTKRERSNIIAFVSIFITIRIFYRCIVIFIFVAFFLSNLGKIRYYFRIFHSFSTLLLSSQTFTFDFIMFNVWTWQPWENELNVTRFIFFSSCKAYGFFVFGDSTCSLAQISSSDGGREQPSRHVQGG